MSTATDTKGTKAASAPRKTAAKAKYALSPEEREQRVQALKEELDVAVLGLMNDPQQWVEFLETVADFAGRYSASNQLLLLSQARRRGMTLSMVLPYGKRDGSSGWLKLGRHVIKDQKALKIWRPAFKRYTDAEAEEVRQSNPAKYKVILAAKRRDPKNRWPERLVGWNIESVFDISQTEGADVELPPQIQIRRRERASTNRPILLTGEDTTGSCDKVVELIKAQGYTYSRVPAVALGTANGRTSRSRNAVMVRADVSDAQAFKTTVHELAHIMMGHVEEDFGYLEHRGRAETEAESVAYIVCGTLGLDTGEYSAPYIAGWADGKPELVELTAKRVVKAAKDILDALLPAEKATTE